MIKKKTFVRPSIIKAQAVNENAIGVTFNGTVDMIFESYAAITANLVQLIEKEYGEDAEQVFSDLLKRALDEAKEADHE